jgi:hypothetical protein
MHSRGSRNSCLPSLSILLETQTYDPLFSSTSVEFRTAISLEEVTYVVVRDNERSKGAKTQFTSLKWQYPRAQDRGRLPKMLGRKEQNHGTHVSPILASLVKTGQLDGGR